MRTHYKTEQHVQPKRSTLKLTEKKKKKKACTACLIKEALCTTKYKSL